MCVRVLVGPSVSVWVGGWLHPLERVISPSWEVFTAVKRIRSRERERREREVERLLGRLDGWMEENHRKNALASTLQHLLVVCSGDSSLLPDFPASTNGGTSECWHLLTRVKETIHSHISVPKTLTEKDEICLCKNGCVTRYMAEPSPGLCSCVVCLQFVWLVFAPVCCHRCFLPPPPLIPGCVFLLNRQFVVVQGSQQSTF